MKLQKRTTINHTLGLAMYYTVWNIFKSANYSNNSRRYKRVRHYRAMLCIARTVPSQDVCPSVCPSVTRMYFVELGHWLNLSSSFLHHRITTSFYFFPQQTVYGNIPTGNPPNGGRVYFRMV